ncbi:hypothetical protein ACFVGY_05375 [Streptomyces sp. NPDC127106]|uniref:hypothetical protein n=1 Tax=Streptomyces sp. NPDC127106 TaxID=3345360 RepID=UPI003642830D
MSEQNRTAPEWFHGGTKLYRSLLILVEGHPDALEAAVSSTVPSGSAADMMLDFLSDELTRTGFTDDWAVTPRGQQIEDLIDVFNDIAQPE